MPVIIESKTRYSGVATPTSLGEEVVLVEIGGQPDDYIVEGYIDLSQLRAGDAVVVREYIAVDGSNYGKFIELTYTGPVPEPVIRFHSKTLLHNMKYKVTIARTLGPTRNIPYGFIVEVLNVLT